MELAVSNIAWTNEEEVEVAERLQQLGVKYVEVAPTKVWEDPTKTPVEEAQSYTEFWRNYDIEVVAFQSILFARPDLKIFESAENRRQTLAYLQDFIGLASNMDAGVMVFGSPKNRQRGDMGEEEAYPIAKDFFRTLGKAAQEKGIYFCIEPNAPQYACDFVTTAQEGINLVKEVASPGFGLHLDIACMTLAGDDIAKSVKDAKPYLKHFHISAPMLGQVEANTDVHHQEAADALREIGYSGYVSIEMRPAAVGENAARVEKAVRFAQSVYSS